MKKEYALFASYFFVEGVTKITLTPSSFGSGDRISGSEKRSRYSM